MEMKIFKCHFRVSKLGKVYAVWKRVKDLKSKGLYIIEISSHLESCFYFSDTKQISLAELLVVIEREKESLLRDWKIRKFLM